jgi:acetyltransferase-like isoleucine patch superfamily enzyme
MFSKIFWLFRGVLYQCIQFRKPKLCLVGKPIFILGIRKIFFGHRTRLFPNSRFEALEGGSIVFGDNVSVGHNLHITSAELPLEVGDNCMISSNVMITNIDHDYSDRGSLNPFMNNLVKRTTIGKNCFIGTGAVILPGTIINDNCIVGANSVVRGDFPSNCMLAGNPAKTIKIFNEKSNLWENIND